MTGWWAVASLCVAGCLWGQASPAALLKQALAPRDANRLEESVRLYGQALKLQPEAADETNGPGWALLAFCEFRNGKHQAAFDHIVRGKALGIPERTEIERVAHYHYLQLTNKTVQFELGASLLSEAARSQPELPALVEMAGANALRLPLLPPEIPAEQREAVMLAGRAAVLAWQPRVPEAKQLARELLEKYPKVANVRYLMGYLCLIDNEEESVEWFRKEIAISPGHIQARLQIAYEYLKRGEADKGLPYAREAVQLAPADFMAHNIVGRLLLDLGKVDKAIGALEAALKLMRASPETHYSLASAYSRAGRKEEAAKHRELFAELDKARKE